jgi:aspartate kinase
MAILVQKYGGSSVADVQKIARVADRVVAAKREGYDLVVVVSAMGKTTDGLLALARSAAAAATTAGAEETKGGAAPKDPPRRELDMLVSTGERVTMALLSIAIHARGFESISFTGSQSGILTNDRHFDARILEVRPHRIEDELARGKIVIVAGYQGMSYRREITTLGRGGSDTTAVALAAALGAERCEIYSDVDGVYSADPRVVPEPLHLPELDLATLQEMAECGAKVLNAQAVEWARRAKIVLHARQTTGSDKETVAREADVAVGPGGAHGGARSVVGQDGVVHVSLAARDLAAFVARAETLGVPLTDVATTGDEATCSIVLLNVPDWRARKAELEEHGRARFDEGFATASVVGSGLSAIAMLGALAELGVVPRAFSAGALRVSALVPSARLPEVLRKLHAVYVKSGA